MRFSLTVKMIGVCAGALMLATAVLTGITAAALLDAFRDVERAHMETQAQRVRQEFHDYLERRMVSASDWGNWDELHFAARDGHDAEFFATNVNAIAARNLNANLILLVGNDGSPRSSFFYDFAAKQAGTPPEDLLALFTGASARLPVASVTKCVFGAFGTSRGTAAFAACPLLNSAGEGPSSGLLVTAHYIDAETVEQIANTMQASITCLPFASDGLPEDFRRAKRSLSTASPVTTGPLGEDRVGAYACITDPAGQPLLIARIDEARTMYQIGASAIRWYALVIVLVGISTVFVLAIALRAIILRPLSRLTRHVSQVANTGTLAPFQHTGPMDEIGVLAQEFNDMVECLAEAREQVLTQSREVSESELRYRVLVELAPMAIAVEVGGSIRYVNSAMLRLLGSTDQSVGAGRALCDFLDPASSGACAEAIANVTRMGGRQQGISGVLNRADGTAAHVEIACACIVYGGEIGVQLALQDVTERVRLEEELRRLSTHDALTGLANRRAFDETIQRECRRAARAMAPITVILADIDSFKAYNDHYGHLGGDEILRRVAQALSGIVLRGGDLVARYGGEELVVVLADTGLQAGAEHAERMRAVVEALRIPHASSVAGPHLTISVGVAACAAGEPPVAEDLIARADQALYLAKSSGRNRVCVYAPSMT